MKVYTKIVMDMDSFEVIEEQSYEYIGPVAEAKGTSGSGTVWADPLNLMGNRTSPIQQETFGLGQQQLGALNTAVGGYQDWLKQNTPGVMSQFQPGSPQENNLFNLEAGRYMDKLLPEYAGSGILTSGPGLNAVSHGLSDFTTQFEDARMKQQLAALLGIGGLQQGGISALSGSLSPLFGTSVKPIGAGGFNTPIGGISGA